MECNKDEAVRARQIAEARMQRGEFVEAIRFAAKAKKLYSEVENITQILTICEVHIAAQKKVSASDMDWYAILQIERLADEATIKKQYRRLALLLHPDKNKFAGAEAAFKLIGQANGVLSDQAKRSFYDRNFEASRYSNVNVFAANHDANAANYQKNSNLNSTSFSNQVGQKTFWTSCQHCNTKYQYCVLVVNATLRCQQCLKIFKAHVIQFSYQGVSPAFFTSVNNPKEATMHGPPKSASESTGGNSVSMKKCAAGTGDHCEDRKSKDGYVPPSRGTESQTSKNVGRKRVRQSAPDSKDSFNGRNGAEMKNANVGGNDVDSSRLNARRSSRKKQNVSYVETSEDDDISYVENSEDDDISYVETSEDGDSEILSKKPRQNGPLNTDEDEKENMPESGGSSNNNNPEEDNCSPLNSNAPSAPKVVVCPDTDFNDFEKGKEEDCFAVNQLWAIYDDFDGMPRFYALVKKAAFPFKLRITWLEPDPDDQGETDWHDAKLPIACGKFRLGSYLVCPNKGEIWAIFRNWDIKWSSNPKEHSEYDLEYVEILSDFVENVGIAVAYLGKVKGFVSLFQKIAKNGVNMFYVLPNELYRFSHRIPSYKMTGNEREGVPIGSFELDPAALPFQF
uniref:DnaJ isogeny subfamily B member 12 n=1 Tax=Cajanus cajan TaxID=3821 RepID=A0A151U510_CAJCA|nr:DnaJ isogeny subfamily B member 12 [Cajanus cajan]